MSSPGRAPRSSARRKRGTSKGRVSAAAGGRLLSAPSRGGHAARSAPARDFADRVSAVQRRVGAQLNLRDALLDVVRAVTSTIEPADIGLQAIERAATWIPAPAWAVLWSDLSGQVSVLASRDLPANAEAAVRAVGEWVLSHGNILSSSALQQDSRLTVDFGGSAVAFPLSARGRHAGALIGLDPLPSSRPPKLSAVVRSALSDLLEPVAAALDTAVQLKRAEALSVTDDLTGLYNARYLNQVLRRETKRAARSNRPLSLLFVDLDGFKSINDTYGHLFGSRALVEAGSLIRGSARETDLVARFGGDEFALILPDTGGPGAWSVAERVRERVASHVFLVSEGLAFQLTASVGIATLPDVARSADALVQAADAAMYQVKARGKNGVHAAAGPVDS